MDGSGPGEGQLLWRRSAPFGRRPRHLAPNPLPQGDRAPFGVGNCRRFRARLGGPAVVLARGALPGPLSGRLPARGDGAGLVFAGPDPLHQLREAGEKPRQQGEQQRDQQIRYRISGLPLAQILEDRLKG